MIEDYIPTAVKQSNRVFYLMLVKAACDFIASKCPSPANTPITDIKSTSFVLEQSTISQFLIPDDKDLVFNADLNSKEKMLRSSNDDFFFNENYDLKEDLSSSLLEGHSTNASKNFLFSASQHSKNSYLRGSLEEIST